MDSVREMVDRVDNEALAKMSDEQKKVLDEGMICDREELQTYQSTQAWARSAELISLEDASALYLIYGGASPCPTNWEMNTLAERIVGVAVAKELLSAKLGRSRS